jgi:hypothetical protein
VVDLGLIVREHQVLQNAAREAAHFSALPANQITPLNPSATSDKIKQRAIDYCFNEKITVSSSSITLNQAYSIPLGGGISARGSEVTITYTRSRLLPGAGFLPGGPMTLTGRSVFRNLY